MDTPPNKNSSQKNTGQQAIASELPHVSSSKITPEQRQHNRHQHTLYSANTGHDQQSSSCYSQDLQQQHHSLSGLHHHAIPTIPEGSSIRDIQPTPPTGSSTPTNLGMPSSSFSGDNTDVPVTSGGSNAAMNTASLGSAGLVEQSEGSDTSSLQRQKSNRYNPASYPVALKLLVSNNVAGSIIGRAGQTISELQTQSKTRIKLSQSNEYYPGTQDRVCLIQGDVSPMKTAIRLLLERLHVLQENQHSHNIAWHVQRQKESSGAVGGSGTPQNPPPPFDFVVRLLVPTAACGMIIGKSGSNIKFMEETTGVTSVRLSPKDSGVVPPGDVGGLFGPFVGQANANMMSSTSERIVTITGQSLDTCANCVNLIVDGMVLHPDTSRYSNMTTSYSNTATGTVLQQQQQSLTGAVGSMIPASGSQPDLVLYTGPVGLTGSNRHHPPLLVPVTVPPSVRHPSSSSHQNLWENAQPGTAQFVSPQVGTGIAGSGLTRRIASSPDLPIEGSGLSMKNHSHHQPGTMFSSSGTPLTPSTDDRLTINRGSYEISSLQQYSPTTSFSQHQIAHHPPPSGGGMMPIMEANASTHHHALYVIQHPHQHASTGQSNPNDPSSSRQQVHHANLVPHSVSAPNLLAVQLDHSLQISHNPSSVPKQQQPLNTSSSQTVAGDTGNATTAPHNLAAQSPTMIAPGCFSAQLLIPDSMIGSILGRGGRTLTELMMVSGTRIRISQRGEYIPNTPRDLRIVTIRGPTSQAVWQAQIIISQRIVLPSTATSSSTSSGPPGAQPSYAASTTGNPRERGGSHHRQLVIGYQHQQQGGGEKFGDPTAMASSAGSGATGPNVTTAALNKNDGSS